MKKTLSLSGTIRTISVFFILGFFAFKTNFGQVYREVAKEVRQMKQAASYYVSPFGDDSNPGTESQPWRTIKHAAAMAGPGVTVYVRNGIYEEAVSFDKSGTPQNRIRFKAYACEAPVIQGEGIGIGTAVRIHSSYFHLEGFEIRNWDTGIEMTGHHIEIADCSVHDLICGISPHDGCHDFVINHVDIFRFFWYGFDASTWGSSEQVCHSGIFYDCIAHDCLDPQQNVDGFAFGDGYNFVFYRCSVYNVHDGFDIKADNTTLHRCSASRCFNSGYKLWAENIELINCLGFNNGENHVELDWDGNPGASTLMNCTFVNSKTYSIWVENSKDHLSVYNCIIAGGDNIGLCFEQMTVVNYRGSHNIFHSNNPNRVVVVGYEDEFSLEQIMNNEWTNYSGQDYNSFVVLDIDNDLFVDSANGNLRLRETSPAIDAGTSVDAPLVDYDCMIRPAGESHDIGAYEYGSSIDPDCGGGLIREKKSEVKR
ncbi:MAG: right-handed parallel beta-helix repeat-containing protein [Candidatus Aminicenantes bacterium]|jgi:hypothetical protein